MLINQFNTEIMIEEINAAVNPLTENPLIIPDPKYQKIAPFTTKEKIPRVIIFKGKGSMFMIGLINIFTKVKHAPTIKTFHIGKTLIPCTKLN